MSQVNLLPPEVRQKITTRRIAIAIGAAGVVVAALLLLFWALQSVTLNGVQNEIRAQELTNAELSGQITELEPFRELQQELVAAQTLVDTAMLNEVSWSGSLRDVQLVIPDQMAIGTMTGTITGAAEAAAAPAEGAAIGNIAFEGTSVGTLRLARWVARQGTEIRGWENPWLSSAQEIAAGTGIYTFSSTVDLTAEYRTDRGQGPTEAGA